MGCGGHCGPSSVLGRAGPVLCGGQVSEGNSCTGARWSGPILIGNCCNRGREIPVQDWAQFQMQGQERASPADGRVGRRADSAD